MNVYTTTTSSYVVDTYRFPWHERGLPASLLFTQKHPHTFYNAQNKKNIFFKNGHVYQ